MSRRRANGHWQNRNTTQDQADALPRDHGGAIPWRNIFMVMVTLLLALLSCTCTYLTQELRATRLELRATQLDLAGKLQELGVCDVGQLRLRTNLTARERELGEGKRELLRIDQHLRTCSSLNEQLNNTLRLTADYAAEALNERDAALQREERQADLLHKCEIRTDNVWEAVKPAIVWTANKAIGAAIKLGTYVGVPGRLGLNFV